MYYKQTTQENSFAKAVVILRNFTYSEDSVISNDQMLKKDRKYSIICIIISEIDDWPIRILAVAT